MGILDEIKDSARKATNSIIDTTEDMLGMPKSPQELSKRLIEYLAHQEYTKVAETITDEAKKYIAKMNLDDVAPINEQLEQFQERISSLAEAIEEKGHQQMISKLKEAESSIPDQIGAGSEVFKTIKSFLQSLIETLETHEQEKEEGSDNVPNFEKLQNVFEEYFSKLSTK